MLIRSWFPVSILAAALFIPAVFSSVQAAAATDLLAISQDEEAKSFIRTLSGQALQTMLRHDISDAERTRYFREMFRTTADLEAIGRFVLGRHWHKATADERVEFLKLFESITVYTWSRRFKEYSGQGLTVIRVRSGTAGMEEDVVVESTINPSQGAPVSVLWKLKRSEKGLHIIDLVVEGISMAVTYRSEYGAVIHRSGGEVGGLLAALRAKVGELRGDD
ncbi:MAG: ABC-type transport system [Rhodospirillaceae bacterium]|nr:MAG: ABC-type transport system [Rhodospirillaceae bacterium]